MSLHHEDARTKYIFAEIRDQGSATRNKSNSIAISHDEADLSEYMSF